MIENSTSYRHQEMLQIVKNDCGDITYQKLPNVLARRFSIAAADDIALRTTKIECVESLTVAMQAPKEEPTHPDLPIKFRVNHGLIQPSYLAHVSRSVSTRKQVKGRALGCSQTMVKISGQRLQEVSIQVRSFAEQATIFSGLDKAQYMKRHQPAESLPVEVEAPRGAILRKACAGML